MELFPNTPVNSTAHVVLTDNQHLFDSILSNDDLKVFEYVNFVTICALVSLFGISANIINIIIFYKQGFVNTVNIAFFSLAISDLCCLTALVWGSICVNPSLPVHDTTWVSVEVMYLSAGWPHACSCRITSYITVYITAERYISIALPLKVKQIITAKRTTLIICAIYIVNIIPIIPEYATSYLGWRIVSEKNKTLIGILFTSSRNDVEGICYVFHALLSATSFVGIVTFTVVLIIQLRKSSQWRKKSSSAQDQSNSISTRDQKTVVMVVMIASVLIVCYIPGAIIAITAFVIGPEFDIQGKYVAISEALWSVAGCFQSINSSINIFLYYRMSTKYRQTFHEIFVKLLSLEGNHKHAV